MPSTTDHAALIRRVVDEAELKEWVNSLTDEEIEALYQQYAPTDEGEQKYLDGVFEEAWARVQQGLGPAWSPAVSPNK